MNTLDFVSSTCAEIRENGYVNGRDAGEQGIRSTGKTVLGDMIDADGAIPGVSEDDEETALNALAWIRDLPEEQREEGYLKRLHKLANEATVTFDSCNVMASLVRAYCDQQERAATAQEYDGSEFQGTVGERLLARVTVQEIRTGIRNHFNPAKPNSLIHFTDGKGNLFVWFTTKSVTFDTGESFLMEAKVKKHQTYNGIDQTGISYVKLG